MAIEINLHVYVVSYHTQNIAGQCLKAIHQIYWQKGPSTSSYQKCVWQFFMTRSTVIRTELP